MQIVLFRRATCWSAQFRGVDLPKSGVEFPLPFTPEAPFDLVCQDIGRRFPQARIFHVVDNCVGCAS
jgi:hypothetical protein